jgi:hypothetical protein
MGRGHGAIFGPLFDTITLTAPRGRARKARLGTQPGGGIVAVKKLLFVAVTAVGLSACSAPIILQNPQTKEMAQCQASSGTGDFGYKNEQCAEAYEKAGWIRIVP